MSNVKKLVKGYYKKSNTQDQTIKPKNPKFGFLPTSILDVKTTTYTENSGGATTRASQGGRPKSLQVRFRVYLLTVKVAENEKDGSEKHRKNIREEGISFA